MKVKYILPILFLLFVSCTDEDNSIVINSPPILVKKIITKNFNDNSIINSTEIEYSGNRIIKSTDLVNGNFIFYTYNNDLISNIKIKDINNNLKFEYLYSYQNDKLTLSMYKDIRGNYCEKRTYIHNSDSNVSFDYYKGDLTIQNTLYKTGTITIQNDEVTGIVVQDLINSNSRTVTNTYDDKNNPHKNVIGLNKLNVELDRIGGSFKNLTSSSNIYNATTTVTTDFSYTYNASGYPISSIRVNSNGNFNYKFEYFY